MVYALNLDKETSRILSVTYDKYAPEYQPRVETFPSPASDYLYINGEFVYDPLPVEPEDPEEEISDTQKIADLEAAVMELAAIIGGE